MGSFEDAGREIIANISVAMDNFAIVVLQDSLEQCPVETGTLRRSVGLEPAHEEGLDVVCRFGYGFSEEINPIENKPAAAYAVPVHELVEKYHSPPTKAKFLEDPVFEHAAEYESFLAASVSMGPTRPIEDLPSLISGYDNVADMFPGLTSAVGDVSGPHSEWS